MKKKIEKEREYLQKFAGKHGLILEEKGECGFGRPCVGLLARGDNYVDYDPYDNELNRIWPAEDKVWPPKEVTDAYHKHNCFAVLAHDDDYGEALTQLGAWIRHLESQGEVYVDTYATGHIGLQAMFSGVTGYAIRVR